MNPYYKAIRKYLLFFCAIALCGRFIHESVLIAVALYGVICAGSRKSGMAIACFVFMPFAVMMNPGLISRTGMLIISAKISLVIMIFGMILLASQRRGWHRLPIGGLFVYLIVAVVSSIDGWFPVISFLKIAQFALFLSALYCTALAMQDSYETLLDVRAVMMALAIITIIGSLFVLPFPDLAYSMMIKKAASYGIYLTDESIASSDGMTLFNGVCYHSQALAPIAAILFAWVLCDMLFVERRMCWLHMILIGLAPIILYLTRSRTAIVSLLALLIVIQFYALCFIAVPSRLKSRVRIISTLLVGGAVLAAGILEMRDGTVSKWLRKTDEVTMDERGTMEAVMESRMGLVERNMYDFSLNPVLGKGFQVMPEHMQWYQEGRINLLSAPIEKGVLPTMILGETGIVGGIVFLIFLLHFIITCTQRHYMSLLSLFAVIIASNMGEASFFSPAGQGGVMWVVVAIGGFCCDMMTLGGRPLHEYGLSEHS